MWGPILFTYCRVEYGRETRKLEITKGEFVGKCKPTRQVSLVEGSKSDDDPSIDDDDDSLGDLQLGRVREEYILDPDLRGIQSCVVLDADKMIVYEDRELFLMTSVVYSENFEAVGKRMQEVCTLSPPLLWMNDFSRFFLFFFLFFLFLFFISSDCS